MQAEITHSPMEDCKAINCSEPEGVELWSFREQSKPKVTAIYSTTTITSMMQCAALGRPLVEFVESIIDGLKTSRHFSQHFTFSSAVHVKKIFSFPQFFFSRAALMLTHFRLLLGIT